MEMPWIESVAFGFQPVREDAGACRFVRVQGRLAQILKAQNQPEEQNAQPKKNREPVSSYGRAVKHEENDMNFYNYLRSYKVFYSCILFDCGGSPGI